MQDNACILEDADLNFAVAEILRTVLGHGMDQFTRADYRRSLAAYTDEVRSIFEHLQQFCSAHPAQSDAALHTVCRALLDAIEQDLSDTGKHKGLNGRALWLDIYKSVIVTYLTPGVFRMGLEIGEPFNRILREEWLTRFPKQAYQPATEDMISEGFNRKWHECYITQAVCAYLGKPDDCYELMVFRRFRDTYLADCPDGPALIDAYYKTAPDIVSQIRLSGQADSVYPTILETYLRPCLRDIENGRLTDCKNKYVEMVRRLQCRFAPSQDYDLALACRLEPFGDGRIFSGAKEDIGP